MLCIVLFDWVLLNSNSKLNSNSCDQKIKRVFFLPFSPFSLLVHLSFSPSPTAHIRPGHSSFPFSFFPPAQFPAHFPRLARYHASSFSLDDRQASLASSLFLLALDSGSSLSSTGHASQALGSHANAPADTYKRRRDPSLTPFRSHSSRRLKP